MGQENDSPRVVLVENRHGHHRDPREMMKSFFLVFCLGHSAILFILSYLDSKKNGLGCVCEVQTALDDLFSSHGYLVSSGVPRQFNQVLSYEACQDRTQNTGSACVFMGLALFQVFQCVLFFLFSQMWERPNILARVCGHQATPWNWWLKKEEVKETCLWVWESVQSFGQLVSDTTRLGHSKRDIRQWVIREPSLFDVSLV